MSALAAIDRVELATAVLAPHFDAARDVFASFVPAPGHAGLSKLRHTIFRVDPGLHNTPRHFAACREDARLILLAPEMLDLAHEHVVALIAHEFGHAADFAYPAMWQTPLRGPDDAAAWCGVDEDSQAWRDWRRTWKKRSADQIEWAADGIVEAVTGRRVGYCGACMIQSFDRCAERPAGLR